MSRPISSYKKAIHSKFTNNLSVSLIATFNRLNLSSPSPHLTKDPEIMLRLVLAPMISIDLRNSKMGFFGFLPDSFLSLGDSADGA